MGRRLYLGNDIPIGGTAHQEGTERFGTGPTSSATALNCNAHELDNLCTADASFLTSIRAVGQPRTIIPNALLVAERINERAT
jgi:choline dehydrogenase-like flavoprotein